MLILFLWWEMECGSFGFFFFKWSISHIQALSGIWTGSNYNPSLPVHHTIMHDVSIKLLHHELAAGLITQEQRSVGRKGADHGGGKTRVECPHA